MKKLLLGSLLLIGGGMIAHAQCGKKVVITSSKTEHLDADSTVQRTDDELCTVEFDKDTMNVAISNNNNGTQTMKGAVKSYSCDWSTPFKEGKTVLKASLTGDDGNQHNITITVTGKAGKIGFLAEVEGDPEKIRLVVDKFQEKQ
jgi:hypothetical protein